MTDYLLKLKNCTKCLLDKDISEFGVDKQKKDGASSHCKLCKKQSSKAHYDNNLAYYKKRNQNFYLNLSIEKKIQYRTTCNAKPETSAYRKKWQQENREIVSGYSKKWYANADPEVLAKNRKDYRNRNPEMFAKHSVKRRSFEKAAMPKWLSDDEKNEIKLIYLKRDFINDVTGIKHEVDHVYPIQGKNCCGLHVPWNLQIITALENKKKTNTVPDYA